MPIMICSKCKKQIRDSFHEEPITVGWCECKIIQERLDEVKKGNVGSTKEIKENLFKRLWNKTIFPDMIKKKKEQKRWEREMKQKAMEAAKPDIEKAMIEKYKQEAIDKMSGKKKENNFMEKLAKGFGADGSSSGDKSDKIANMMGMGNRSGMSGGSMAGNDKIASMLGLGTKEPVQEVQPKTKLKKKKHIQEEPTKQKSSMDFEDKIKRMLE